MSQWSDGGRPATEDLSALADGELEASAVAAACLQWRDEVPARQRWHAYQLIGDVLRSEDLASPPGHDEAFLQQLRARLEQEPVVLAPSRPVAEPASAMAGVPVMKRRRSWASPVAIAAGFAVVAGTLVVTQIAGGLPSWPGQADELTLARSTPSPAPAVALVSTAASSVGDAPVMAPDQYVRDVRLDEYLAAHKRFGGSSLPGGPSGYLRNAAVDVSAR